MKLLRTLGVGALVALLPLLPLAADAAPGDNDLGFGYLGGTRLPGDGYGQVVAASDGSAYVIDVFQGRDVRRLLPSGLVDPGFGTDGAVALDGSTWATTGTNLLLGGTASNSKSALVRKVLPTGPLDPSFGTGGTATVPLSDATRTDSLRDLDVDAQGRVIVLSQFEVARLRTDGSLDPTFGQGSTGTAKLPGINPAAAVTVDPTGAVSVLRSSGGGKEVVHLTSAGSVDSTWGTAGTTAFDQVGFDFAAIDAGPDGSIVVGGSRAQSGTNRAAIARVTPGGRLDPTFGFGGYAAPLVRCTDEITSDLVVLGSGLIVTAGTTSGTHAYVARYAANGTLDPSFGNGGWRFAGTETIAVPSGRLGFGEVTIDLLGSDRVVVARTGSPATARAYDVDGTRPVAARPPADDGYWTVAGDGTVQGHGALAPCGASTIRNVVGGASSPEPDGYWLVNGTGQAQAFGKARDFGSYAGRLNAPMVSMDALPGGDGYWLMARDGGIFSYGAARFYGSMGGRRLNSPIFGIAATAGGHGYWLVAGDGGIFSFGDARFFGSTGSRKLAKPIVDMAPTPTGNGYWLVGADGAVFPFGDAGTFGTAVGRGRTIVGITPTTTGHGYWLLARDGTVFAFGDAVHLGNGTTGSVVLLHE